MIILDTNVVSELMREKPAPEVLRWAEAQSSSLFFVTAVTKAEVYSGIHFMAHGQKRKALHIAADRIFSVNLGGRVLAFDSAAADQYAFVLSKKRAIGREMDLLDCQIAATALVHQAQLATRDVRDFEHCGIAIINPWNAK